MQRAVLDIKGAGRCCGRGPALGGPESIDFMLYVFRDPKRIRITFQSTVPSVPAVLPKNFWKGNVEHRIEGWTRCGCRTARPYRRWTHTNTSVARSGADGRAGMS